MIKVAVQGKEVKEVEFTEGMFVSHALRKAGYNPDDKKIKKATITVNNKSVGLKTELTDNSTLVVTTKVSNG